MYLSGHILTTTLAAKLLPVKLRPQFGLFLAVAIASTLVDADHLWGYAADDGTASSFSLYLLHRFWWAVVAVLSVAALALRRFRELSLALLAGVSLHYMMDYASDLFRYNLAALVAADALCFAAIVSSAPPEGVGRRSMAVFGTAAFVVPWLTLAVLRYALGLDPAQTPVYHISTIILTVGFALSSARLFRGGAKENPTPLS